MHAYYLNTRLSKSLFNIKKYVHTQGLLTGLKAVGKNSKITLMVSYQSTNLVTGPMLGPPKPSAIGRMDLLTETKLASSTWNGYLTKEVTSSVLAKNITVTFF